MSLPADYSISLHRDGYAVTHSHFGELESGIECRARAEDYCHDHAAEAQEAAQYEPSESLQNAVADFLTACDRGLIEISRSAQDSSFVVSLRKAHAAATARAA